MKTQVLLTIVTFRPGAMIVFWGERRKLKLNFFMISGGSSRRKKFGDLPNIYITSLNFTAYRNKCYGSPNEHRAVIIGAVGPK